MFIALNYDETDYSQCFLRQPARGRSELYGVSHNMYDVELLIENLRARTLIS
jgi:hypothetical protein